LAGFGFVLFYAICGIPIAPIAGRLNRRNIVALAFALWEMPEQGAELAPITAMMSSRLMVLANLLKRGAMLRCKRTAGLSSVEYGLVANLGRQPPMSVARLAEAVGLDKGQISRALADLVSRKLVAKGSMSMSGITAKCWCR
jgi:MarR family